MNLKICFFQMQLHKCFLYLKFLLNKCLTMLHQFGSQLECLQVPDTKAFWLWRAWKEVLEKRNFWQCYLWCWHFWLFDWWGPRCLEYQPSWKHPWLCGWWLWDQDWGGQHSVPLLRYVEDHFCLAYRGHGSVQHQLSALWSPQVLVCCPTWTWTATRETGTR